MHTSLHGCSAKAVCDGREAAHHLSARAPGCRQVADALAGGKGAVQCQPARRRPLPGPRLCRLQGAGSPSTLVVRPCLHMHLPLSGAAILVGVNCLLQQLLPAISVSGPLIRARDQCCA